MQKLVMNSSRFSCHRFRGNEVRLWLSMIAYNLWDHWRPLTFPKKIGNWSLTSVQQRLVKTGGRLVKHARYYWLVLAEGHLWRQRFGSMLRRIAASPLPNEERSMRDGEIEPQRPSRVGGVSAKRPNLNYAESFSLSGACSGGMRKDCPDARPIA